MDNSNYLTPNKILRLIHLAEDKSFNNTNRPILFSEETINRSVATNKTPYNGESSSGILDLERLRGFGEISVSTPFNPGEMTGRSTEASDTNETGLGVIGYDGFGRHSVALESITSHMEKQTQEVSEVMRNSIACSFSSKYCVDLTAEENRLIKEQLSVPLDDAVTDNTVNLQDSVVTNFNMSVKGDYFKQKCPNFSSILAHNDSPDKFMRPSISEVSSHNVALAPTKTNHTYNLDQNLDSVPVKQEKSTNVPISNNHRFNPKMSSMTSEIGTYAKGPNLNYSISKKQGTKPTDVLLRNIQSSYQLAPEDTETSLENSLSISKIADFLNQQSLVNVSDMLQLNARGKQTSKKQPLTEVQMNIIDKSKHVNQDTYVTYLKDTKNMNSASSAGTLNTVISLDSLKISKDNNIPEVIVTKDSINAESVDRHIIKRPTVVPSKSPSSKTKGLLNIENLDKCVLKTPTTASSKSPSSKSQSTLTTVQENRSFKSSNSPLHSSHGESEANTSHIPSPNVVYKELDKSVDWHEVLQQKHYNEDRFAKGQWIDIVALPVQGYVGVSTSITIKLTTRVDSWLTAKIEFDNSANWNKDLTIELPRQPILLSPGKTDVFKFYITSNTELNQVLPFTINLKDASINESTQQKDSIEFDFKLPPIQVVSTDGMNKVLFPSIQEKSCITKYFVIGSDCAVDLQLELSVAAGDAMFLIKSVQEIVKSDMGKALMESPTELGKAKASKQLCRLIGGNAIKVAIMFKAPLLSDLDIKDKTATFKGVLNVNLIGINKVLKKVDLIGTVGTAQLEVQPAGMVFVANDPTSITLYNSGTVSGVWIVKFKTANGPESGKIPFKVSQGRLELGAGAAGQLFVVYIGPLDALYEGYLLLEEITTSATTTINICGGTDRAKTFPIKTNFKNMSWVKAGKKEISLKNSTNKKVQIRCQIIGEGFSIESVETRGTYVINFGPCECRPLSILFNPNNCLPYAASLHLVYDKNSDFCRKVKLHGCDSGEPMRWSGLVTYGATALVHAALRRPIELTLYNSAAAPTFLFATVNFNLQYKCLSGDAELLGGRRVIGRRGRHTVVLRLDWSRFERRARVAVATTLATITVLTGPELTRQRVLKILRDENNGQLDTSLLPEHVRVLAEQFEGEDPSIDKYLENFSETKASLKELIESLQELTAQIEIPQDFIDDNTILITEDTVLEHHTLCE